MTRLAVRYVNGGAKKAETKRLRGRQGRARRREVEAEALPDQGRERPVRRRADRGRDRRRAHLRHAPARPAGRLWAYFDALPAGTVVSVEMPQMFPFEDVVVTEGAGHVALGEGGEEHALGRGRDAGGGQARRPGAEGAPQAGGRAGRDGDLRSPYFEYGASTSSIRSTSGGTRCSRTPQGMFQATPLGQHIGRRHLPSRTGANRS